MTPEILQSRIQTLIEPYLREQGVEVVELALKGSSGRRILRLFVDRSGGITIDECARISRGLADILDTDDPIQGSYVLEVSSPGLDRPLKSDRDFHRALGKEVRMQVEGRGELRGRLTAVEDDEITIQTEGDPVTVSRLQVLKANLHFEI